MTRAEIAFEIFVARLSRIRLSITNSKLPPFAPFVNLGIDVSDKYEGCLKSNGTV